MKRKVSAATLALVFAAFAAPASAAEEHKILGPNEVKWSPGPASLPKAAEAAVLFGDPSKEGPFAMRLKMPKGYQIAPHSHPKPEVVTVVQLNSIGPWGLNYVNPKDDPRQKTQ